MRAAFRVVVSALVLMLGVAALPASAAEGLQPAVVSAASNEGVVTPVIFKSGFSHMKVEELVAIAVGAAIVGSAADMFLESGLATAIAVVAGAAIGSHWYEEELWPLGH